MRGASRKKALTSLAVFCLGTSALTAALPASAAVIDYPNGSNNSSLIVLTDNSTQLQVLTGSASQSGQILGTFALEKIGAGTLAITTGNAYAGTATISAGTLAYTGSGGFSIGAASGIVDNATFDISGVSGSNAAIGALSGTGGVVLGSKSLTLLTASTFAGTITGSGGVNLSASGTTTFTGVNSYTGTTTISPGNTLVLSAFGSIAGNVDINNGAKLSFGRSGSLTFSGVISGQGSVVQSGSGVPTLTAANTYSGGTTIQFGALGLGTSTAAGTGAIMFAGTGFTELDYADGISIANSIVIGDKFAQLSVANGTATQSGAISEANGSQSLTKFGFGTLILTGNNTYTGGTNITLGTLQVSADQNLGSPTGPVTLGNNSILMFGAAFNLNASRAIVLSAVQGASGIINTNGFNITLAQGLSGSGNFVKTGTGILTLNGAATYTGATGVNQGVLQLGVDNALSSGLLQVNGGGMGTLDLNGHNQTVGALGGGGDIKLGTGTLTVSGTGLTWDGVISGAGKVVVSKSLFVTNNNTYTGGTTVASTGNLTIGQNNVGSIVGDITDNGIVTFNRNDAVAFAGAISGTGSVIQANSGTTTLTGANTYSGGTTINSGTLRIGNGGTSGSIVGNVTDNRALIFNRSDAVTFAGVISGSGTVAQSGSGTATLSATSTYTGTTSVNAGTLNVTGKIAGSGVSVAGGGTLSGTGTVSTTTVASGGTLMPGSGGTPGTLTVSGNLTLASGANFVDFVTPSAAGLATASGTASINGSATANFVAGTYVPGQRYALVTATGGLTGTFSAFTTPGLPASVKGRLSYDANNVYLNLDPNALAPLLSNATGNQRSTVKAIDTAVLGGAVPPAGFQALYGLSGSALNSAIDQISGLIGPNIVNGVGQGSLSFLSLVSQGGDGGVSFAPGSAYGAAGAPHRAQLGAGETRVWGAAYGGHVGLSADAVSGAASLSGSNVGLVGGIDMQVQQGLLLGAALGWGSQDFGSGNGTGDSDDVSIGLYARHEDGPLYVSAALGYGWHHVTTLSTVTVSGTDVLRGVQDATDFGGRLEAGWHLALDDAYAVTPYAAFMGDSLETPAYAETAASGSSAFALSYAGHTSTLGRTEVGAKLSRDYAVEDGILAGDLRAAWAHQIDDVPLTQATFLGLAGASFVVAGVHPARDSALLGASLEMRQHSGLFFGVKGETQLGAGTTIVEGMGTLGWRW